MMKYYTDRYSNAILHVLIIILIILIIPNCIYVLILDGIKGYKTNSTKLLFLLFIIHLREMWENVHSRRLAPNFFLQSNRMLFCMAFKKIGYLSTPSPKIPPNLKSDGIVVYRVCTREGGLPPPHGHTINESINPRGNNNPTLR